MIKLPKDLLTQSYTKPRVFLCEVDKTIICQLETTDLHGTFKFNAYSELSFTVSRTYTNVVTGKTSLNPFYDKIEALRLILLEGFGYFEIQDPEIISDGIKEVKNVTAYSLEYTLSQKYLEEFSINTGKLDSVEYMYSDGTIVPVTLVNMQRKELSLLHIALQKMHGWNIGHVDESLKTMSRTFEISRVSVYDFIVQDICEKFSCFAVFDTINNTVNLYAEALIAKFIGDGKTTQFTISPAYDDISSVAIDSYKTTEWTYQKYKLDLAKEYGVLTLNTPPAVGAVIEVTDNSQQQWQTDVYVSFQNLAQEANISYNAEDIKTVLTVKGADDIGIEEVNMGFPYITDLSYYYSIEWMGQELYDAYTEYSHNYNSGQSQYKQNAQQMIDINNDIAYETNRTSLEYSIADNVTHQTQGTYYIKSVDPNTQYVVYTEVTLPADFNSNTVYYTFSGSDIDETKFASFYKALQDYFMSQDAKNTSPLNDLKKDFLFLETYTMDYLISQLNKATTLSAKDTAVMNVLGEIWDQLGRKPLDDLYRKPYELVKETNETDGWNNTSNANYWQYYPVTLVLNSLNAEIAERDAVLNEYKSQYEVLATQNSNIASNVSVEAFFRKYYIEQGYEDSVAQSKAMRLLMRLNPFLREDEYTDDNFLITEYNTTEEVIQVKQELMECGNIELKKLCEPKLEFSMNMANIYALPEFEPIIHQFDLGNLITVELRSDYIKKVRLLQVDFNFEDFSDFSCEFGELTNLKTPSSIHADLLANALSAGKSVASNSSYWQQGTDTVTNLALKIQQGLLDATTVIKAIDGNQGVEIDKYGIHLRKYDPNTGAIDPKEGWIVNNQFLYSDDNFKTTKSVFGEYTVDNQSFWGLIAEAVMAGYVVGCTIEGGIIKIGLQSDGSYAFEVRQDGSVIMNGNTSIAGYAKEADLNKVKSALTITSDTVPSSANEGQLWLNTSIEPYELMVYTNGQWVYFAQQEGQRIYASKPSTYAAGDLWILGDGEVYPESNPIYSTGNILRANESLAWVDVTPDITTTIANIKQYFEFNQSTGLKIGQKDEKFYVNISSTRMSFYDKSNGETTGERERDPDEVVYISNKSAVMKKLVVEDDASFESPASFEQEINMYKTGTTTGFTWKIESNGSLSLVVTS